MFEYNTTRLPLVLKEYGRNIQKLVDFLMAVEDPEKRKQYAETLVELMKQLNPNTKDYPEYQQKLWDDLYIISNFELEVEGPFPKPERDVLDKKPQKMGYKKDWIKYKHYGKNLELLIKKATTLEDPEEKEAATIHIGKLMKTFYITWNKDSIDDSLILNDIQKLSEGKLSLDLEVVREQKLFESKIKERNPQRESSNRRQSGGGGGSKNKKKRKKN